MKPSDSEADVFTGIAPTLKYLEMTWGPRTCRSPGVLPSRGSSLLLPSTMRMSTSCGGLPCRPTLHSQCQASYQWGRCVCLRAAAVSCVHNSDCAAETCFSRQSCFQQRALSINMSTTHRASLMLQWISATLGAPDSRQGPAPASAAEPSFPPCSWVAACPAQSRFGVTAKFLACEEAPAVMRRDTLLQ